MKKIIIAGLMTAGLASMAFGANRIGPVSQYGQLQAGKNAAGKGRIYGSCAAYSTSGNEVAVQGMSLFWSMTKSAGIDFWNGDVIKGLVDNHKIQLIRAPMGVDGSWEDDVGNYYTNAMHETAMNAVVQAAIDNDIYVLIDYHSHCAEKNTSGAAAFFEKMAQKWGKYDNVIFEIYNEPKNGDCDWSDWYDADAAKTYWKNGIYPYANTVISAIRKHSDNLIVVGTPYYDQYVDAALAQPLNDKNVAYTFHYYAGEDPYRHKVGAGELSDNPENMMNKGYSVFVTEWGNSAPSGDGGFTASYSATWYNWVKQHQLSGANWSVSNKAETASYFNTGVSASTPASQWSYTESGNWTNQNVFASLPSSYKACDGSSAPVIGSGTGNLILSSASLQIQSSSSQQQVVASSNSQQPASGAANGGAQAGDWNLTVAQGGTFDAITITGVSSFSRNYGAYFLDIKQEGDKVIVSAQNGTVPEYLNVGNYAEVLTINGEQKSISVSVVAAGSVVASSASTAIQTAVRSANITIAVADRMLNISGVASADVDIFDLQGRPMLRLKDAVGSADLNMVPSGNYIVRVHSGALNLTRRISLK